MESESSLLPPSEAISATSATSEISRKSRSRTAQATWAHARTAILDEPELSGRNRILYCIHCPSESPYSSHITTNFRRHLQSKHRILVEELPSSLESTITEKLSQLYI